MKNSSGFIKIHTLEVWDFSKQNCHLVSQRHPSPNLCCLQVFVISMKAKHFLQKLAVRYKVTDMQPHSPGVNMAGLGGKDNSYSFQLLPAVIFIIRIGTAITH